MASSVSGAASSQAMKRARTEPSLGPTPRLPQAILQMIPNYLSAKDLGRWNLTCRAFNAPNPQMRSFSIHFETWWGDFDDQNLRSVAVKYPNLTHLDLSGCQAITERGLEPLSRLSGLQTLRLASTNADTDSLPNLTPLQYLTQLVELDLSGWFETLQDEDLAHLRPLTRLRSLNLDDAQSLSQAAIPHLQCLTNLEELQLMRCEALGDEGFEWLRALPRLRSLSLQHWESLTDENLESLSTLTQLEELDLTGCSALTEAALDQLQESLPHLAVDY